MERKYLDLITSLVEHHKRFSGLEEILDDIVNDVYQRAETILSSVEDDKLLISYLEKLVSTSIISVPQKLKFKKKRTTKSIDEILNKENNGSVEKDSFIQSVDIIKDEVIDLNEEIIEPDDEISEEILKYENDVVEQENLDVEDSAEKVLDVKTDISVDQTLVDKMINGVSINVSVEDNCEEELNEISFVAKEELDDSDNMLISELEEIDVLEVVDSDEELISDSVLVQDDNIEIKEQVIDIISAEESLETEVTMSAVPEETLTTEDENFLSVNDIIESDSADDFIIQEQIESSDEDESFDIYNEEEFEDKSDIVYEIENESDDILEVLEDNSYKTYMLPEGFYDRFNSFDFEPKFEDINSEDICLKLSGLNSDYTELSILKICELKFYQNKSISEIADVLKMSPDKVLDALDKIIDVVKY